MNIEKSWFTCREAADLLNYTQRHIVNLIKKGKLSAEKDENGKYYIQKSEFFRVYPTAMKMEEPRTKEKSVEKSNGKFLEERVRHLQELIEEKNKQTEYLKEQISNFTQEKSKMLDAINGHTRLLYPTRFKSQVLETENYH
jgi:excisionase family DNA binding protein